MSFHVPEKFRVLSGPLGELNAAARGSNNGLFEWSMRTRIGSERIRVIASDGEGWEHVSVSFQHRTPSWAEMCAVKDIFWDESDCVIQFHPSKEDYVNFAEHCLHLWRPTEGGFPKPPSWMVGPKESQ